MTKKRPDKKQLKKDTESEASVFLDADWTLERDSKLRLVLLAAKRSKQLQKGRKPRVVRRKNERDIKTLGVAGTIGVSRIRSAIQEVAREAVEGRSS